MGKTKIIVILCLMSLSTSAQEEQKDVYIRPGLLSATIGLSPSWMLNRNEFNYYVSGFLEGFLTEKTSLRGEGHYLAGSSSENPYFRFNCRLLIGAQYHFSKNNFDAHLGLFPGVSLMQIRGNTDNSGKDKLHVVPTAGVKLGVSYYVWKYFHFFADATYIKSTAIRIDHNEGLSDELMISAGLGFNVNLKRKRK